MERFTGPDAAMLHLETPRTPMHTLKVLVLDTTRRRRPLTREEVVAAVGEHLGVVGRATQRVEQAPGFGGRPFWVDVPDLDVDAHVDHVGLPAPGGRSELDALCGELASTLLPRDRPLWAMTLVDGLDGGRQAVVVRVHHAITDGIGALNAFLAATTESPGGQPPRPAPAPRPVTAAGLRRAAALGTGPWLRAMPGLLRDGITGARRARAFRSSAPDLPPFVGNRRTFCNTRSAGRRVCASSTLPLAPFLAMAKERGVTVNGVLHGLIAGALRAELLARGESPSPRAVALFSIAVDRHTDRRWGNDITPTVVGLHTECADPLRRLELTARSCRQAVDLRHTTGLAMAGRWSEYTARASARLQRTVADRIPRIANHITTANIAGPRSTRWLGEVEVVDWCSFAVAVPPSYVNLTVYSYAGHMSLGLITTPEVFAEPGRFLERIAEELDVVRAAVAGGDRPARPASPSLSG
jgi:diacylglycerol O-acyltransferase